MQTVRFTLRVFVLLIVDVGVSCLCVDHGFGQEANSTTEQNSFFESRIRPILVTECYSCHSNKTGNSKGGLRLDTRRAMELGGSSGPIVVPGDPDASLLISALAHQDLAMPPDRQLSAEVVRDFRMWIEMGAPDPRQTEFAQLDAQITAEDIQLARQTFWAYQAPERHRLPAISEPTWTRSDIDFFVLAALDAAGLTASPDAEPRQLLRRLSYDLVGLPPSSEQITAFARSWQRDPDQAILEAVDRLLEMPQFGERWARHWLDLVRYAESNGREVNVTMPHAWRYRDYVIDSFNADKPYDRFLQEQLAGDLLPARNDAQRAQNLIATTFLALGPKSLSERNSAQFAADLADEQLDTTTRVMLGTSVACARCHDHKFDPIPQSDYYALAGIFGNTETFYGTPAAQSGSVGGIQNRNNSSLLRLPLHDPNPYDRSFTAQEIDQMKSQIRALNREIMEVRRAARSAEQGVNPQQEIRRLRAQVAALSVSLGSVDEDGQPLSFCMGVQDRPEQHDTRILVRGEIDQPGQIVARDFPQVLRAAPADIAAGSSGRRELAAWIANSDNPLTARVMVNRVWQHMFGAGIVRSTEDFGMTGEAPSHPELLDNLALDFVDSGWSIKDLIRRIAASRTYRQSSQFDESRFERDPDNRLLSRANLRRLDAEAMRDSILYVADRLDLERPRASEVARAGYLQVRDGNLINISQSSVLPGAGESARQLARQRLQQELDRRAAEIQPVGGRLDRRSQPRLREARLALRRNDHIDMVHATYRSIYMPIVRDQLPRALGVFDFAEPSMVVGQRESSHTPDQSLFMLNNDFVLINSMALAERLLDQSKSVALQVDHAFQLVYGRLPTAAERGAAEEFFMNMQIDDARRINKPQMLAALCQSLFASAEFRIIE